MTNLTHSYDFYCDGFKFTMNWKNENSYIFGNTCVSYIFVDNASFKTFNKEDYDDILGCVFINRNQLSQSKNQHSPEHWKFVHILVTEVLY